MAIESVDESIISKKAGLLVEPAIRQFRYMFGFNNCVKEFNERKQNLALALDRLQNAVDVAERNAEEIEKDVTKWLEDANNEINGVNPLENEIGKNGKCFTWCPNWIRQFKLSKELAKKTETFRNLEDNSKKFKTVSHKANIAESSKEAFKQIMKALKDDNVNVIGLCGMEGVGKTTLVKEVGRIAAESQLFDKVLMVTVSQNPDVMDIQNRMADSLVLHFDEKSKEGRAERLWKRLLREKKMLIILDDVWKVNNLKEIGIPFGDDHRGCKILLTTRFENISSDMGCQKKVFLSLLSENEAWALFKIIAGLSDGESTLNIVAKQVARECQGLPTALVTVGRALRGKDAYEWEAASKLLKNSQFPDLGAIDGRTYACLKLSYDYLKPKETKLCFLLCCLFPEDYNIPIEDLTRYAVGYGLHQDVKPIEDVRERVYAATKDLKDSCMLLGTETEEHVKMHDLVRDVAIQIASSEEYGFMVLKKWPRSIESVEGCTTISLLGNKLTKLPEALVCPRLKVLLLELGDDLNVPGSFFKEMTAIEVFSLKGGCLSLQSLELSTNLLSLLLIECKCNGLNLLRKLQRLRILCFMRCYYIETLPEGVGELKELRLLDVTGCKSLREIPMNLIGRLKKLEELLIGKDSFKEWDVWTSTGIMNASLKEVNSLSQLAVLSLRIPEVKSMPSDFVFPMLYKYDIILGNYYSSTGDPVGYPTSTRLFLGGISATSLNAKTFEQLFPTVSQIVFKRVAGLENIINSLSQFSGQRKGFLQRLEFVDVDGCEDICTLFPAKLLQALKNLRSVNIESCESLEEVFELGEGSKEEKDCRCCHL